MPTFHFNFGGGFSSNDEGCEFESSDQATLAGLASMLRDASERPSRLMAGEDATMVVRDEYRSERAYTLSVRRLVTP